MGAMPSSTLRSHHSNARVRILLLVALVASSSAAACKDSGSAKDPELEGKTATLTEGQESLLRRRDALLNSRRALREKRQALVVERQQIIASGGDTSEIDKQTAALTQEESKLGETEAQLEQDLGSLFDEQRTLLSSLAGKSGESAQVAARESSMATREKIVGERERKLAEREATVAAREAKLAERERNTCGAAPAPTIIQAAPPPGTSYSKRDVDPTLQKARRRMSSKGILPADLPAPVRGLEKEAAAAMKKGDYSAAYFAAKQLLSTVESMNVDRDFIRGKFARVDEAVKRANLSEASQGKKDGLFKDATRYYGDGQYDKANKKLNEIYNLL